MSRDGLVPESLNTVSERFNTPTRAISLTGAVLLVLVAFVPLDQIAKLASAFQILVFVLVNLAVVAFRESDVGGYEPSFETPLYPFPQVVGVVGGLALLPFIGLIPFVGAVLITVGSLAWYYAYVSRRGGIDREGVATDAVRRSLGRRVVEETESVIADDRPYEVLVAVTETTGPETESGLVDIGAALARHRGGSVSVVRFDEVPDQAPLESAAERLTPDDRSFEDRMQARIADGDLPIEYGEVVSHDTKHAIVNRASAAGVDALLLERRSDQLHTRVFGSEIGWIQRHAPCDVIQVEHRGVAVRDTLAVVTDRGPYDPVKVMIADALAADTGATIEFLFAVDPAGADRLQATIRDYLESLEALCTAPVEATVVEAEDRVGAVAAAARGADLLVVGAESGGLTGALFGRPADRIVESVDCSAVLVRPHGSRRPSRLRLYLENRLF